VESVLGHAIEHIINSTRKEVALFYKSFTNGCIVLQKMDAIPDLIHNTLTLLSKHNQLFSFDDGL